jgi:5-methylcytosine-specific restriction protein B
MDLAFRRRFGFLSLAPALNNSWMQWMTSKHNVEAAHLEAVRRRFDALNASIRDDSTLGAEFMLGHSFVTPPAEERVDSYVSWFRAVVKTEIAPTLNEYWFEDSSTAVAELSKLVDGII